MNPCKLALIIVCGSLLLGVARAQDDNNQPKGKSGDREGQMEARLNQMTDTLGLTGEARAKFKSVLQEQSNKMREIFQQSNGDREKARPAIIKLREETVKQLKDQGILNDEQLAKFQQMGPPPGGGRGSAGTGAAGAAQVGTSQEGPAIKPIESLWLLTIPHFPGTSDYNRDLAKRLKEWQATGVFDGISLLDYPPTFVGEQDFATAANVLMTEAGGRFIITTLPVGKEGWESSGNPRLAQKLAGTHYDASKAMPQAQWLETMKDLKADTWGWVPELTARMPTPESMGRSAGEFARFAKSQHKKVVIWLTAETLTHGRNAEELTKAICEATRADADYYTWMDLEAESLRDGEPRWRESMGQLLDKILALTPKEKTVIQWINNPRWPAKDVAGTKAYIAVCQAKGINRFGVLANLAPAHGQLDQEPWHEFYRTLPKAGHQ
jgi:Spy/CpxP family protein refolding chaperone